MSDIADETFSNYCAVLQNEAPIRDFLRTLYKLEGQRTKHKREKLLKEATVLQLDYVIKSVYHILNHDIPVKLDPHGHEIKKRRMFGYLRKTFENKKVVAALLKSSKSKKIDALTPITCFHQLFYDIVSTKAFP